MSRSGVFSTDVPLSSSDLPHRTASPAILPAMSDPQWQENPGPQTEGGAQGPNPSPFAAQFSPNLPELLGQLDCSLALTTYQAGKLVLVSGVEDERLVQLPRSFRRAMALARSGSRLAVATLDSVIVYANDPRLAARYPKQPDTYDSLFVPRLRYYTGNIDNHGLAWGTEGLYTVNTAFNAIGLLGDEYSFRPTWTPPWMEKPEPGDRSHVNGFALVDGKPKWITALGQGTEPGAWRKTIPGGGVLLDTDSGEIVAGDLQMPHSPRIVGDGLFILESATGELSRIDTSTGQKDSVARMDGFVRGMSVWRDHLFVAFSKLRKNSSTFRDLPIADKAKAAGIAVIHAPSGATVAWMRYNQTVDEIFDVEVLPGLRRPGIVRHDDELATRAFTMPHTTFWALPEERSQDGNGPKPENTQRR